MRTRRVAGFRCPAVRLRAVALALGVLTIALGAPTSAAAEPRPALRAATGSAACADPCFHVAVMKVGAGTVTSNPGGIACGTICEWDFLGSPSVWVTPTPAPGGTFHGWAGTPCDDVDDVGRCLIESEEVLVKAACVIALFERTDAPDTCVPTPPSDAAPPPPAHGDRPPPLGSTCTILGSNGPDVIRGTPGNDVICGRGGNDVIDGRGGHDLLVGGKGRDRVHGGSGNDLLVGGPGADRLLGGAGADTFYARDRTRDVVKGGPGRDRARVDEKDVLRSIERKF